MRALLWSVLALLTAITITSAQSACDVLSQSALRSTDTCLEQSVGEVCAAADSVAVSQATAVRLLNANDRTETRLLDEITTVQNSAAEWGVARFRVPVYAADAWQLVAMEGVLFGGVSLTDTSQTTVITDLVVTQRQGVNIRRLPRENATIIGAGQQGDLIRAVAVLEGGAWLQVPLPDGRTGWVSTAAIDGTLSDLPIVTQDAPLPIDLAQPFSRVQLGASLSDCASGIHSGLLLQTPSDAPAVSVSLNDVAMLLNGTLWAQVTATTEGEVLWVANLEGALSVKLSNGETTVTVGEITALLLNRDDATIERVSSPRLAAEQFTALPVTLLSRPFYVPVDIARYIRPRPTEDVSPLATMLATEPCRITTGPGGSNLRAGAGTDYPIMGVMAFRESASVLGRAIGSDGQNWWNIGPYLWISGVTTVTGGDCAAVALLPVQPPR